MKVLAGGMTVLLVLLTCGHANAADEVPGGMRLLPGYKHERLQGFDSVPGKIAKPGGVTIHYDIGRVTKPGAPQLGGDFSDQAKRTPAAQRKWYREQVVDGQPFHLALTRQEMLLVSLPKSGVNFSATVKTSEQMADALLMILTFSAAKKDGKAKQKAAR